MDKSALLRDFSHKKYGFFEGAAVQVCEWNREAIRSNGKIHCYKQDFYGADTLSCHQVSPAALWCNNSCIFCWRPKEYMGSKVDKHANEVDPKEIIDGLIEQRKKLISGFGGHEKVSKEFFARALEAKHWAISLSGEPTLYKKLPELIRLIKMREGTETVFLVTNGQNPKMLQKLWKESNEKNGEKNSLPTQLYISMVASDELLWKKITCNRERNGWENYLKSLALLKLLPCRTVIRLTIIKGVNDYEGALKGLAELLEIIEPDFIEVKAYMFLGYSRKRLKEINMPSFEDVKLVSEKLLNSMPSFVFESEKKESRIVLLKNKGSKFKTKIIER
jgi:tRNA wybutosine-synthesizing protein 1